MSMIEDGTGTGYSAKVSSDNRLEVHTHSTNIKSISRETGRAYSTYVKRDITVANTEEPLGVIEYTGAGELVISEITFSMSINSTDFAYARIEVHVDPTGVSGGTAHTAIPMNRGNLVVSDTTVISGDTAITIDALSSATEIYHTQLCSHGSTAFTWSLQDSLILIKGDKIVISTKGASAGATLPSVRATVRSFEEIA